MDAKTLAWMAALSIGCAATNGGLAAQQRPVVELSLERMVDLALSSSYQVRQLNIGIDRTRLRLQAERARLRSRVDLELSAPDFNSVSERYYDATLGRNVIVHENSRRWEGQLSIRQPVIIPFVGYPTNGYLSLNNRVYRYTQLEEDGTRDLRYYNRYFVSYTQPLFQPNELKNDIEEAELDLEDTQLNFYDDVVRIIDDVSEDYFELFEIAYRGVIDRAQVANLEEAVAIAQELADADTARTLDVGQMRVELANARERVRQSESRFRLSAAEVRTRLDLPQNDSIVLEPVISIRPVTIDVERATQYALQLTPRMRRLDISYRESEIDLENTRGNGGIQMDVSVSYGREMQDPVFRQMWGQPTNTYTIDVNAEIPLWDWGERRARIRSAELGLEQWRLRIEQNESEIRSDVENQVRNVEEFESRTVAMEENLALASELSRSSLELYRQGNITALELLQSFRRELDTATNFLDTYLGWRESLQRIQELTFFDFERGIPVLERYGIGGQEDMPGF